MSPLLGWFLEWPFVAAATTAMLIAAWVCTMAMRRCSAALRSRVLCTTLVMAAALPVIVALVPDRVDHHDPATGAALRSAVSVAGSGGVAAVEDPYTQGLSAPLTPRNSPPGPVRSWIPALVVLWLVGVGLGLVRLGLHHRRAHKLIHAAQPVDDPACLGLHRRLCAQMGRRRSVPLLDSGSAVGPLTAGWLRPQIVLPADWRGLPPRGLEAVLRHELAHVRRRDNAVSLAGSLVGIGHWFNPLAWWALHRFRQEAESACDDAVLLGGVKPSAYARVLLAQSYKHIQAHWFTLSPTMSLESPVSRRIHTLFKPGLARRPPGRWTSAAMGAALGFVIVPLAPLRPAVPAAERVTPAVAPTPAGVAPLEKIDALVGLQEMWDELCEARAIHLWHRDPSRGVRLPEGMTRDPAGSWTVETHDAIALPGAKYGCIFASHSGYLRAARQVNGRTLQLSVQAMPHPDPGSLARGLDQLLGLFGCGVDGDFRAYGPSCIEDGEHIPYGERVRSEFQSLVSEATVVSNKTR